MPWYCGSATVSFVKKKKIKLLRVARLREESGVMNTSSFEWRIKWFRCQSESVVLPSLAGPFRVYRILIIRSTRCETGALLRRKKTSIVKEGFRLLDCMYVLGPNEAR